MRGSVLAVLPLHVPAKLPHESEELGHDPLQGLVAVAVVYAHVVVRVHAHARLEGACDATGPENDGEGDQEKSEDDGEGDGHCSLQCWHLRTLRKPERPHAVIRDIDQAP